MSDMVFVCPGDECRKSVTGWGYTYDSRRNMYVCCVCFQPHPRNWAITVDCLWCGEIFTLDVFSAKAMNNATCRNCGGNNYATEESTTFIREQRERDYDRWVRSRHKKEDLSERQAASNAASNSSNEAQDRNLAEAKKG